MRVEPERSPIKFLRILKWHCHRYTEYPLTKGATEMSQRNLMGKKAGYLSYFFFAEDPKILPMVILPIEGIIYTTIYQLNI